MWRLGDQGVGEGIRAQTLVLVFYSQLCDSSYPKGAFNLDILKENLNAKITNPTTSKIYHELGIMLSSK